MTQPSNVRLTERSRAARERTEQLDANHFSLGSPFSATQPLTLSFHSTALLPPSPPTSQPTSQTSSYLSCTEIWETSFLSKLRCEWRRAPRPSSSAASAPSVRRADLPCLPHGHTRPPPPPTPPHPTPLPPHQTPPTSAPASSRRLKGREPPPPRALDGNLSEEPSPFGLLFSATRSRSPRLPSRPLCDGARDGLARAGERRRLRRDRHWRRRQRPARCAGAHAALRPQRAGARGAQQDRRVRRPSPPLPARRAAVAPRLVCCRPHPT